MRKLSHVGIPTSTPQAGECYNADLKVFLTDYSQSENKIEYLRFEEGTPMHPLIVNVTHLAYEVPCLESAVEGKEIIMPITVLSDTLSIAFIVEEGIAVELMEVKN